MSSTFVPRFAALAIGIVLVIAVGCLSTPSRTGKAPLVQKSEFTLARGAEKEIIFPTPFAAVPELVVRDNWFNNTKVIECKPDRFRVRNEDEQFVHVTWTATGERPAAPTTPPAK